MIIKRRSFGIKADEGEPAGFGGFEFKKPVFRFVEILDIFGMWDAHERAVKFVAPAVKRAFNAAAVAFAFEQAGATMAT